MPLAEGSPSQLIRSSRAPLPRWKRATGSRGRPSRFSRARYCAHSRDSGSAQPLGGLGIARASPARRAPPAARGRRRPGAVLRLGRQRLAQPGGEARDRREGGEGLELGQLAGEFGHDQLDQEVAERDPAQALQAVVDRVEDRGVGRGRVADRRHRGRSAAGSGRPCRRPAPPRRRSTARRAGPGGRRRSSAGRPPAGA